MLIGFSCTSSLAAPSAPQITFLTASPLRRTSISAWTRPTLSSSCPSAAAMWRTSSVPWTSRAWPSFTTTLSFRCRGASGWNFSMHALHTTLSGYLRRRHPHSLTSHGFRFLLICPALSTLRGYQDKRVTKILQARTSTRGTSSNTMNLFPMAVRGSLGLSRSAAHSTYPRGAIQPGFP